MRSPVFTSLSLSMSLCAGALAVLTAGCDPGQIIDQPGQPGGTQPNEEAIPARLITTAVHTGGNRFDFYQNLDGSMELIERGRKRGTAVEIPTEMETDMVAIYRLISPNTAVPESLREAQRNYDHAKANGLLGTPWLPPGPSKVDLRADDGPIETVQQAVLGEEELDGDWFRDSFCHDEDTNDPQRRCFIRVMNNWTWGQSRIAFRALTLGMSSGAGRVDVTYQSCAIGIFCKNRIEGTIQQGEFWRWKTGSHKSSFTYRVIAPGIIWHFANTIGTYAP